MDEKELLKKSINITIDYLNRVYLNLANGGDVESADNGEYITNARFNICHIENFIKARTCMEGIILEYDN